MRTYTCNCGNLVIFGSDTPAPCEACTKCGTTGLGEKPKDHKMIATDDLGQPLCVWCVKTEKELKMEHPTNENY